MPYDHLDRATLAGLVPELLLCGHLIDRAGMPHLIGRFGREGMGEVAIEEWMAASPVYTRRTIDALGLEGDGITTMFKCLQHDIGAPPQFLDFRFTIRDEAYGEFALAHCGALMDVEPMGEDFVHTMCHDIEDPTFDATAAAVNPQARIRPIHRPPRVPAGRTPACAWTVVISDEHEELPFPGVAAEVAETRAATFPLVTGPADDDGLTGYAGDFQADVDWSRFSRALLLRLADEIALQCHLLSLGYGNAVRRRGGDEPATELLTHQIAGVGGVTSGRLRDFLGLPAAAASAPAVLAVHPMLAPAGYTGVSCEDGLVRVDRTAPGALDPGWVPILGASPVPWQAIVHGVAPTLAVEVEEESPSALVLRVVDTGVEAPDSPDVQLTRFSTGADFRFEDRHSLPITPV